MDPKQLKVFASERVARPKSGAPATACRFRIELVTRGNGTVMYSTRPCDTREQAIHYARTYLTKNPHLIDTTKPEHLHGWGPQCPTCLQPTAAGHGPYCAKCWTEKAIG